MIFHSHCKACIWGGEGETKQSAKKKTLSAAKQTMHAYMAKTARNSPKRSGDRFPPTVFFSKMHICVHVRVHLNKNSTGTFPEFNERTLGKKKPCCQQLSLPSVLAAYSYV